MTKVPFTRSYKHKNYKIDIFYSDYDFKILQTIGKWWTVTPDHIHRTLLTPEETHHYYLNPENNPARLRHKDRRRIVERINTLNKAKNKPIKTAYIEHKKATYWLTTEGGRIIGAPYGTYPKGNTTRAPHAWAAADIGIRLQQEGYTVYSERETSIGETIDRETEIWEWGNPINPTPGTKATNPQFHTLRPDLTIPTTDGKFIFIEIERRAHRSRSYYHKKINSYLTNPKIAAIWYITDQPTTAKLLNRAYQHIKPNHPPKPFRILPMKIHPNHYTQFTGLEKHHQELTQELNQLNAQKETKN